MENLNMDTVTETMKGWLPGLGKFGLRVLIALAIILIGFRIVRMLRGGMKKSFDRMGMDLSVSKFLLSVIEVGLYALVAFIAADELGIPSASIIALLGSAGLAVGLSLQGSLANVAGGIVLLIMRPFSVGDYIICGGVEGVVQSIGLMYTTLMSGDNRAITIPNGNVANSTVVNVTVQEKRRVDIQVGIGYGSDIKTAKEILSAIYEAHPLILQEEGITVYVSDLGDSAVVLGARGWSNSEDYWTARWDILEQIKQRFDEAGIEIPFQQVDVNVKKF